VIRRLLTVFLFCIPCTAQVVAVRAGHLVDPAKATVADNQVILIREGKIAEVGPSVNIPPGATTVDLSNQWVLPGLVDAHTHITMNLPVNPPGGSLWENKLVHESTAFRTARGLHNAQVLLNAGFLALLMSATTATMETSLFARPSSRAGSRVRPSSAAEKLSPSSAASLMDLLPRPANSGETNISTPIIRRRSARLSTRTSTTGPVSSNWSPTITPTSTQPKTFAQPWTRPTRPA